MNTQEFSVGPKFVMGHHSTQTLSQLAVKKAYIICDPFMEQSKKVKAVTDQLEKAGAQTKVFSKVVPNPTIEVIAESISEIKEFKPDLVVALGGGSAIDSTKAVLKVYTESEKVAKPKMIAIPTTSGSGSEITAFAVISDPSKNEKFVIIDDSMVPDLAILDTYFTMTVPAAITADAGMDVLTHALEAYVAKGATDFSDACAEKAVSLSYRFLFETYKNGENQFAREKMHNASALAGIAFNNAGLGICHSLSHAIGAFFHLSHGRINAMLLPHVVAFNASLDEKQETFATKRYSQMANLLGIYGSSPTQGARALIYAIKCLAKQMNMPMSIEEMGIDRQEFQAMIPEMAKRALADACTPANPRSVTLEDLEAIYRALL
ncbi:1-propanol dehydrogenase PduQ [Streptococcus cameli]